MATNPDCYAAATNAGRNGALRWFQEVGVHWAELRARNEAQLAAGQAGVCEPFGPAAAGPGGHDPTPPAAARVVTENGERCLLWPGGARLAGDGAGRSRREAPRPRPRVTTDMPRRRRIALIAHDNKKDDLLEWARYNRGLLAQHELCSTGTTGSLLAEELDLEITRLKSGPLGGDQQIGARIAGGEVDFLIFFWDPLEPHPHDPDVKALLRLAVVWNIPIACNRASADFMFSSPLMSQEYTRQLPDYEDHLNRVLR
jgi:methylglyoxal synthase